MITQKNNLRRRFLLAATLAAGFGTAWFVIVIWLGTSILQALPQEAQSSREVLIFLTDGTPLIQTTQSGDLSLVTYRDLKGRERTVADRDDQISGVYLYGQRVSTAISLARTDWPQRINIFMDERERDAVWYFVHDDDWPGSGYFVGYERTSNRLIGYIGLAGFRAQPVPSGELIPVHGDSAFAFGYWSSVPLSIYANAGRGWALRPDRWDVPPRLVHVPSGKSLRVVDLSARTVTTVFEAPAPIVSVGIPYLASYSGRKSTKELPILVRAGQKIYKLDHQYKLIGTFTMPAELDHRSSVSWYEADNGQALVECVLPPKPGQAVTDNVTKTTIYVIADDGSIRDSFEVALQAGSNLQNGQAAFPFLIALGCPVPAVLVTGGLLMAMNNPTLDFATVLGEGLKQFWPWLAIVLALSSILAAVSWRRGRVFELSRRDQAVWVVFVLLFGAPAFAGFLLHRRWPVREPCPHCHARCARDRDACAECGTLFPAPALKGTEIFA